MSETTDLGSQTDLADKPVASLHLLSLSVCLTQDLVSVPDNLESLVKANPDLTTTPVEGTGQEGEVLVVLKQTFHLLET